MTDEEISALVAQLREYDDGKTDYIDARALLDTIEALKAERDELDFLYHEGGTMEAQLSAAEERAESAEKEASALRSQLERAREALEPFSSFAGELFARNYNKNDPVITLKGQSEFGTVEVSLTFEAFIAARRIAQETDHG